MLVIRRSRLVVACLIVRAPWDGRRNSFSLYTVIIGWKYDATRASVVVSMSKRALKSIHVYVYEIRSRSVRISSSYKIPERAFEMIDLALEPAKRIRETEVSCKVPLLEFLRSSCVPKDKLTALHATPTENTRYNFSVISDQVYKWNWCFRWLLCDLPRPYPLFINFRASNIIFSRSIGEIFTEEFFADHSS